MELTISNFKANLKSFVDKAIAEHRVIRINRRKGKDFVVMSAEDYEREQETIYVLRNQSLMNQIAESFKTINNNGGYKPSADELNEINRI